MTDDLAIQRADSIEGVTVVSVVLNRSSIKCFFSANCKEPIHFIFIRSATSLSQKGSAIEVMTRMIGKLVIVEVFSYKIV